MLYIGYRIDNYDDNGLVRVFDISYRRSAPVERELCRLMEDGEIHVFESYEAIRDAVLKETMTGRMEELILPPEELFSKYPYPIPIIMTGSRRADKRQANEKLYHYTGMPVLPSGFTWHHSGRMREAGGGEWACDMIAVRTSYHKRFQHQGPVREYMIMQGVRYQ